MQHARHPSRKRGSPFLKGFQSLLDRVDAHIQRTYPEDEEEKIKKLMLLMFGEEPRGFIDPSSDEPGIPRQP